MLGKILVGTSSWADPGFIADWYPRTLPASERLPYYAAHFRLVELNSSFYSIPSRGQVQRWCEQTPPGFTFDVKLHRVLSRHSTELKFLPPALRREAPARDGRVELTPEFERAVAEVFLNEIQPLSDCGKLGAFLLQLTPGFSPRHNSLEELDDLLTLFKGRPLAVELRNRHWVTDDELDRTLSFFKQRRLTLVGVDAPAGEHFMIMPSFDVVTNPKLAYVRLHGRNQKGYVSGKTVAERFAYLYSDEELEAIGQRVAKLAAEAAETHVLYNNNASDYALRNAATFQQMLARDYPETVSESVSKIDSATQSEWGKTLEFDFELEPSGRKKGQRG